MTEMLLTLLLATAMVAAAFAASVPASNDIEAEAEAKAFLVAYDSAVGKLMNEMTIAQWNYETNITDENAEVALEASLKV